MNARWAILASMALAVGVAPLTSAYANGNDEARENERVVPLESIPAPARKTLLDRAAGAPILKTEQAKEHGLTVYSAHVKGAQGEIEIVVDATGHLLREGPETD